MSGVTPSAPLFISRGNLQYRTAQPSSAMTVKSLPAVIPQAPEAIRAATLVQATPAPVTANRVLTSPANYVAPPAIGVRSDGTVGQVGPRVVTPQRISTVRSTDPGAVVRPGASLIPTVTDARTQDAPRYFQPVMPLPGSPPPVGDDSAAETPTQTATFVLESRPDGQIAASAEGAPWLMIGLGVVAVAGVLFGLSTLTR